MTGSQHRDWPEMTKIPEQFFKDAVASRTQWQPIRAGGANYQTAQLVEVSPRRFEYRPTQVDRLFTLLCLVVGVACVSGGAWMLVQSGGQSVPGWLIIPFGLLLLVAGVTQLRSWISYSVFDLEAGVFQDCTANQKDKSGETLKLTQIYAIQILREKIRFPQSKYSSYELNLVLQDASRRNVIDHGDIETLRQEADRLAKFLGVSVWDASF